MEVQELQISQLTEERLRLLEFQVAELISDVILLKDWKNEITKHYLTLDISRTQTEAVVPTLDVKQEQLVSDTTTETANKVPEECSDTSPSCIHTEEAVLTSNLKQDQVMSDIVIETANGQMAAQEYSDAGVCGNLELISSESTVENAGSEKCKSETLNLKCEVSTLAETTSLSDKDAPVVHVITAVNTQERLSETSGATKESKERSPWLELLEEEEQGALPSEGILSEQGVKQSSSSNNSQQETSVSSQESKEHDAMLCRTGNKHSVLANLVKSTVQCGASECRVKRNSAIDSSKQRFDRQKTDSMIYNPEKQKTELHNSGDEDKKKTVHSSDKQKSVALSIQANQENESEQKLQSKDKLKVVEKNALFAYMMKHKALSQNKYVEEEQLMQDMSVTIKENKCPTCKCKIATHKETKDSEEEDSISAEMVKKMSKEELQKKYLQLQKRHQTLVNALCDSSTLSLPDDPHALLNAARDGNIEEAILLTFSPTMMEFRDEDGYAPLHLAVWSEHIHICKLLLAYNMPVNVKDNQGNTPLHFAARKGNVDICKVLLDWHAPLNASNTFGSTPLHCAVKEGHAEVFFLLVSKGALVHLSDKWNNTALHMAACNGFLEICQLLVNQGVEVNAQNSMGITPLHNACKAGHTEVAQYLVKRGAHLSIKCKRGKMPKEMLNTVTHSHLLEWLTKWEKHINSDLDNILVN